MQSYFLFDGTLTLFQSFELKGDEFQHIQKSRRIRLHEQIDIQDKNYHRYECKINHIERKKIVFTPQKRLEIDDTTSLKIHLFIGMVKEKAVNFILQKCTELGVSCIHWIQTEYSQALPKGIEKEHKLKRWEKITLEACKQSGRVFPPTMDVSFSIQEAIQWVEKNQIPHIFLVPSGNLKLETLSLKSFQQIAIFIGPEGGLTSQDLNSEKNNAVSLGNQILRTETATITIVSLIQFLSGSFG